MRILIIDDDKVVRERIRNVLSGEEFGQNEFVERATHDGTMRVLLDRGKKFDGAFCDTMLGKRADGLELAAAFVNRSIPFVGMSSDGSFEIKWLRGGAVDFLRKPFSKLQLAVAFGGILRQGGDRNE